MSISAPIPATVQIRRGHLLALIGAVAALAASVTWVTAVAFDTGTSGSLSSSSATSIRIGAAQRVPATFTMTRRQIEGLATMAAPQTVTFTMTRRQIEGLSTMAPFMSMTPAQLAGLRLGTGYQLSAVLASMSPETRRYTERIMNLTFEQLAAGAAGQP